VLDVDQGPEVCVLEAWTNQLIDCRGPKRKRAPKTIPVSPDPGLGRVNGARLAGPWSRRVTNAVSEAAALRADLH